MSGLLRLFKVKLNPGSYGSEHQHEALRQADGKTVKLVEALDRGFYRTGFKLTGDFPDSGYARSGYLVVRPDKDGKYVS